MLVGGHVSTAGGLDKAFERGVELGCDAIQVFNQSPRAWRPTRYSDEALAAMRERMRHGPLDSVVIHAVYLINCASDDPEIRAKSLASLTHALRVGDGIGADGVVLHPGSRKSEDLEPALARVGEVLAQALSESERCPLLLENTAGAGATIGRTFAELAAVLERSGGDERIGVCVDCCHLFASGYDIRTPEGLSAAVDELEREIGIERLRCLHVNDSQAPLGSNRDRHARLPDGELGREGLAAFLSEPRFEALPALLEGGDGSGTDPGQIALARELREEGLAARR